MKICISCGDEINPLRVKALPNTKLCIGCAEGKVGKKRGVSMVFGEGDHTYNDLIILDEDQYASTFKNEDRDLLDVEPEQFLKDDKTPIKIKKRKDL
jgi:hypothetical protein